MRFSIFVLVAAAIINTTTAGLVGGHQEISKDDPYVKTAANKALSHMQANTNDELDIKVTSAQSQVIAGIRFDLNVVVTQNGQERRCSIVVKQRADLGGQWFVESDNPSDSCYTLVNGNSRQRISSHLLGGEEELDLNEHGVKEAANWAVDHINRMSNSMYRQGLLKIADGSMQVVHGFKYRFLLYLVSTTCRNNQKNSGKSLEECPSDVKPMRKQCDVTVLHSDGEYSMLDFNCKALKVENMIGGDDHDYKNHGKDNILLGGDDHDYKNHGKDNILLGGDDHDYKNHGKVNILLGGDDHDYKNHGKDNILLGGDDHDYKNHGKDNILLGGDDHDYKNHGKVNILLGGDDHDYKNHGKVNILLGGDDHDYKNHGKVNILLGGDDHDYKNHGIVRTLLGRDDGDKVNILGGDKHDYQPHGAAPCDQYRVAFDEFKSKHQRLYSSRQEEAEKFQIFCGNMERVQEYQKMEKGTAVYGATKFADISESEFKEKYLGWNMRNNITKEWPSADIPKGPIAESWDWRDHNAVTPVKNQGSCGSCWAFSTTGNIEGQNAIKHKKLISLSEQELLDCDKIDLACNGGLPSQAYEAIIKIGGLETEEEYKYDAEKEQCKFKKSDVAVKLTGAVKISKDEGEIAAWLYKNGPISIGINAFAMQFYMGGIAHPWKIFCNPTRLDHGVLIVGYGKEGNEPYWIVKNSWGSSWGREGYYYVYRGDGVCGLNTMCTSAIVD